MKPYTSTIVFLIVLMSIAFTSEVFAQTYKLTFYSSHPTMPGSGGELDWSPGHVWIGVSGDGIHRKVGYYPGGVRAENRRADVMHTFHINRYAFYGILTLIDEYPDSGYLLGSHDCKSFVRTAAMQAGLHVPSEGVTSPSVWLSQLVDIN